MSARDDYPALHKLAGSYTETDGSVHQAAHALAEIDRLRALVAEHDTAPTYNRLERGARRLVTEVWAMVDRLEVNARSAVADAALDLRDDIDPNWMPEWRAGRDTPTPDPTEEFRIVPMVRVREDDDPAVPVQEPTCTTCDGSGFVANGLPSNGPAPCPVCAVPNPESSPR